MKKLVFLSLVSMIFFSSCGLLLRDRALKYEYDRLPSEPIAADADSYSLYFLDKLGVAEMGITKDYVNEKYVDFKKYQYVRENGDLMILYHFLEEDMSADTIKYTGKLETQGIAASNVPAKEGTLYKYKFDINTQVDYSILDGHRNLITSNTESYRISKEFEGAPGKDELAKKWAEAKNAKMNEWLKEATERNLDAIKVKLQQLYDHREATGYINTYSVRKADKNRLEDMDLAFNVFESGLTYTNLEGNRNQMLSKFKEARSIWKRIMKKQKISNKDQAKVYYACAKNIANSFFIEEQYDSTLHYLDLAARADTKDGELRRFRDQVRDRMETIQKNENIQFIYAGKYDAVKAQQSDYLANMIKLMYQGDKLTTRFGETYTGGVEYVYSPGDYINVSQIKITEENTNRVRTFRPNDIEFVFEGDKKFRLFEISPVKMLKVWMPSQVILETNYAGVYKNPDGNDFILTKKMLNSERAASTFQVDFADINRGIKLFFSDCQKIKDNADNNVYSKSEQSLKKLVLDYTECKM